MAAKPAPANQKTAEPKADESTKKAELDEIKEVFQIFDKDNSGSITTGELATVLKQVNRSFTAEQLEKFIKEIDSDGNGEIDFTEFVQMMRMKPKSNEHVDELYEAFKVFDKDGDGTITATELQATLAAYGQVVDKEEIDLMISTVDLDGNGCIDYNEFKKMMTDSPVF